MDAIPVPEALSREARRAANVFWNLGLAGETVGRFDRALEARAARDDLVARWHAGKDKDVQKQPHFCREVISDSSGTVAVFERFAEPADSAALFTFSRQSGPHRGQRATLTKDPAAEAKMCAAGRTGPYEQVYILALTGEHRQENYKVCRHLPAYPEIRCKAMAAFTGVAKPLSSLSVETAQPSEH